MIQLKDVVNCFEYEKIRDERRHLTGAGLLAVAGHFLVDDAPHRRRLRLAGRQPAIGPRPEVIEVDAFRGGFQ